jgi:hypothetical protein
MTKIATIGWIALGMALSFSPAGLRAIAQPSLDGAVMQIVVRNPAELTFVRRGTAFHVGSGIFYTSAHVVKSRVPQGFTEWFLAGTTATRSAESWLGPLSVECIHPLWRGQSDSTTVFPYDVARLRVPAPAVMPPVISFHPRAPISGMRVRSVGFASASHAWPPVLYTAAGRIAEVSPFDQTFTMNVESGFTLGGASGAPVLTEENAAIGIIFGGEATAMPRTAASMQIAVAIQAVHSMCPK